MWSDTEHRLLAFAINDIEAEWLPCYVEGCDYISSTFSFDIKALSSSLDLDTHALLGKLAALRIGRQNESPQWVHGMISAVEAEALTRDKTARYYQLRLVPRLTSLTLNTRSKIHASEIAETPIDMIKRLLKEYHFQDISLQKLTNAYSSHNHIVQYQESDYNFMHRLLEKSGIYYFFRSDETKHTLYLSDTGYFQDVAPMPLRYRPERMDGEPCVLEWHHAFHVVPEVSEAYVYDARQPDHLLHASVDNASSESHPLESLPLKQVHYGDVPLSMDEGALKVREQHNIMATMIKGDYVEAKSNCVSLKPASLFTLTNHYDGLEDGQYAVLAIMHRVKDYTGNSDVNSEKQESQYENTFVAFPEKYRFVPEARYTEAWARHVVIPSPIPLQNVYAPTPQLARVTGPKTGYVYASDLGEIKLQYHWDKVGLYDENSSAWARVKQTWAGQNYGSHFIPRVGEEVIVMHEFGDPNRPIVLGSVNNADALPAFSAKDHPGSSGLKTHALSSDEHDRGHVLRFNDTPGSEKINLDSSGQMNVCIDGDQAVEVGSLASLIVQGETMTSTTCGSLEINAQNAITFNCGSSSVIVNSAGVTFQADHVVSKQ